MPEGQYPIPASTFTLAESLKKGGYVTGAFGKWGLGFPGSEGDGIAEVLFGEYNFSGKLPHSWPKSVKDYKEKYGPNFWDKSIKPLYPLGYGLNY